MVIGWWGNGNMGRSTKIAAFVLLGKRKLYGEDCGWGLRGLWSFSKEGYNLTGEPGETPLGHGHATNKNIFPQVWIPIGCSGEVEIRESKGGSKWIMYSFDDIGQVNSWVVYWLFWWQSDSMLMLWGICNKPNVLSKTIFWDLSLRMEGGENDQRKSFWSGKKSTKSSGGSCRLLVCAATTLSYPEVPVLSSR